MAEIRSTFERLPGDDTLPRLLRELQVPLQAELLRAGAQWEEGLAVLRQMGGHRQPFPAAAEALAWFRATDPTTR